MRVCIYCPFIQISWLHLQWWLDNGPANYSNCLQCLLIVGHTSIPSILVLFMLFLRWKSCTQKPSFSFITLKFKFYHFIVRIVTLKSSLKLIIRKTKWEGLMNRAVCCHSSIPWREKIYIWQVDFVVTISMRWRTLIFCHCINKINIKIFRGWGWGTGL